MYVPPPKGTNVRLIYEYLCGDSDAHHTAKFSLFGGSTWAMGAERFVHRTLLNFLAPLVKQDTTYDAIIMPDADDNELINITNIIYGGR